MTSARTFQGASYAVLLVNGVIAIPAKNQMKIAVMYRLLFDENTISLFSYDFFESFEQLPARR